MVELFSGSPEFAFRHFWPPRIIAVLLTCALSSLLPNLYIRLFFCRLEFQLWDVFFAQLHWRPTLHFVCLPSFVKCCRSVRAWSCANLNSHGEQRGYCDELSCLSHCNFCICLGSILRHKLFADCAPPLAAPRPSDPTSNLSFPHPVKVMG